MKSFQKYFLLSCSFLLVVFSTSCKKKTEDVGVASTPSAPSSPNIVFIVADDMGWDVFGRYPNANGIKARTPTLDSLALNGITFDNFWVNPECTPTRAAMLTGKYGFRTGIGTAGAVLPASEIIIQKYISTKTNNAYSNAVIGKWHVSGGTNLTAPESFGAQYYSGFLVGAVPDYYNWTQTGNGTQQNITTYTTTHFVNQAALWAQQQTKPFFLWLALNAPHAPFHRPPLNLITNQSLVTTQTVIDANPLPYYQASIEAMDKEIARLISSLTAAQKENTLFIFMGDNGTPTQVVQTPYSANKAKSSLYQGGINTPLIICGKNVTRKNEVENAMVQAPDMFTTIADIAGAGNANYQDGISVKSLLTNANATKRTFAYSEFFGNTPSTNDGYAIRNENYKLIHLLSGTEYLYKISSDPFEQTNLMLTSLSTEAQTNLAQLRQIKTGL
jgi:arylsulfatase B